MCCLTYFKGKITSIIFQYLLLVLFQIGKEHSGLKAVTEILQDIQYKVKYLQYTIGDQGLNVI